MGQSLNLTCSNLNLILSPSKQTVAAVSYEAGLVVYESSFVKGQFGQIGSNQNCK